MYQLNPISEAILVKNTSGRVFHKGQMKQASYSLKQTRLLKASLQLKVSKIDDAIKMLEKKLAISNPLRSREIQNKINSLLVKKASIGKMIKLQDGIISNHQAKIQRMAATNKKVGASMK